VSERLGADPTESLRSRSSWCRTPRRRRGWPDRDRSDVE